MPQVFGYTHINSATETDIKSGSGHLKAIIVNTAAVGTITVADAVSGATPVIAVLQASVAAGTYEYDLDFQTGLTVTTAAAASDITVVWR